MIIDHKGGRMPGRSGRGEVFYLKALGVFGAVGIINATIAVKLKEHHSPWMWVEVGLALGSAGMAIVFGVLALLVMALIAGQRWTVVAIPRAAALRESAMRADDPDVWHVARYRWRWVAELVARRRTRLSATFDYDVRRS